MASNEPTAWGRRFLGFCVAVLVGIVLLWLAIQLLSQFWGWLALFAVLAAAVYVAYRVIRWRRDRW